MKAQMHRELESHHIIYLLVQRVRVGHSLNWVACEQFGSIKINAALLVKIFFSFNWVHNYFDPYKILKKFEV